MALPNLSTDLLRTFTAVVETGGFLRAAERLHKTQSTVSQQMQKLEAETGATLFRPDGRKRKLTAAGETFYGYARRMLDLQDSALAAIRQPGVEGQLRLGVSNSLSDGPFPQLIARFIQAYPRVTVNVHVGYSADLQAAYERGEFDAVLVLEEQGKARSGVVIETHRLLWISPRDFAWDREQPLPIATFDRPCGFHQAATEALDRARIPWRLVYTTSGLAGLMAAVKAGLALTARTQHAVQPGTRLADERWGLPGLPSYDVVMRRSTTMPVGDVFEELLRGTELKVG